MDHQRGEAEIYSIIAMTDRSKGPRGASAFILEKGTPGFEFGKKEKKMGIRASTTRELIFQDCFVPKENLLAKEGMGFIVVMRTFDKTVLAWEPKGWTGSRSSRRSGSVCKRKEQFGKKIISFQAFNTSWQIWPRRWRRQGP